ncbi:IclR family transcriptional regulator domain-containing protein [Lysinibacillus sp. LZ02]|uniref:IclR family transcriptional regulator domain-containing protein n=1 Tax=Lysinibacillus sp. LZ02 TaxID=3420668 RepID=UPI003D36F050
MENEKIKETDLVQSLVKGLMVIRAFSEENPELTISEAAKITGLSRPATRRILLTLTHLGYLHHSKTGSFSLTPKILSLGFSYISSKRIWTALTPFLEQLSDQVQESTSISVLDGDEIVYVARVATKKIMSVALNVGSRLPAYATSMGQVLLAHLPEDKLETYLAETTLKRYTDKTIIDTGKLRERLSSIKEKGYVIINEELEVGLNSIAAPLRNNEGKVVAAINVSIHSSKIGDIAQIERNLVPYLLETAKAISNEIANVAL